MLDFLEIYNTDKSIGIITRKGTLGKELDLVNQYIKYRKDIFKPTSTNKLAIFLEPKINNSYPDIVFVEYNPDKFENWNKNRFKLESSTLRILYHIINSKGIDFSNIVSQLGISWKDTALAIEMLYDSDLIIRQNKKWKLKNKSGLSIKRIEAVEAKISKLNDVMHQALINQNFASESYALSYIEREPNPEAIQKFNNFGIGLYIKNKDGFKVIEKSKITKIPVSYYSLYFNEWIGRVLLSERKS